MAHVCFVPFSEIAQRPPNSCGQVVEHFTWRQLAELLRQAAEGQQDVAVVSDALRIVLQLEGAPCR